jgi:hypothetical protein
MRTRSVALKNGMTVTKIRRRFRLVGWILGDLSFRRMCLRMGWPLKVMTRVWDGLFPPSRMLRDTVLVTLECTVQVFWGPEPVFIEHMQAWMRRHANDSTGTNQPRKEP